MRILGNIIWLVFGGLELALGYLLAGIVMFVLIITIPFGVQSFKLGMFALWPFGRSLVKRQSAGGLSFVANILWLLLAGWWLALFHVFWGIVCFITIIGIPFGIVHMKLAGAALWPFGRDVVPAGMVPAGQEAIAVPDRPALPPGGAKSDELVVRS